MIPDQNNQPPLSEHERIEQLNESDLQKITGGVLVVGL
jgi:bacteriocin-like protein